MSPSPTVLASGFTLDPRLSAAFMQVHGFALAPHLLALTVHGSASYNTVLLAVDGQVAKTVDRDFLGVVLPPVDRVLGFHAFTSWQWQHEELDVTLVSLDEFARLIIKNDSNIMQMLWLRPEHYLVRTPVFDGFVAQREALTTRALFARLVGFAKGQFHRMTPFDATLKAAFADAKALIERAGWRYEQVILKASMPMPAAPTLDREALTAAVALIRKVHTDHFQGQMGDKRKALVQAFGFDTKNAHHMLRLLAMAFDYHETGRLVVYRTTDRDYLCDVKRGRYTLEQVKAAAQPLLERAEQILASDGKPDAPRALVHDLLIAAYREAWDLRAP